MTTKTLLASIAAALIGLTVPSVGLAYGDAEIALFPVGPDVAVSADAFEIAKRGRGRGRGGDRDRSDDDHGWDDRHDHDDSGRDRPRIPGGSGCDDPEDILEHPECRV
jgi:hypothetical protein